MKLTMKPLYTHGSEVNTYQVIVPGPALVRIQGDVIGDPTKKKWHVERDGESGTKQYDTPEAALEAIEAGEE